MGLRTDMVSLTAIGAGAVVAIGATALFAVGNSQSFNYDVSTSCITSRSLAPVVAVDVSRAGGDEKRVVIRSGADSDGVVIASGSNEAIVISPDVRVQTECFGENTDRDIRVRVERSREAAERVRLRADELRLRLDEVRMNADEMRIDLGDLEIAELESLEALEALEGLEALELKLDGLNIDGLDLNIDEIVEGALAEVQAELEAREQEGRSGR